MIRGLRWWRRSPWRGGPARRRCGPGSAGRRSCAVAGSRRLWGYRRAQSLPTAGLLDQLAERAFRAVEHPLDHYGRGLIRTASSSAVFTALQPRRSGSARSISASTAVSCATAPSPASLLRVTVLEPPPVGFPVPTQRQLEQGSFAVEGVVEVALAQTEGGNEVLRGGVNAQTRSRGGKPAGSPATWCGRRPGSGSGRVSRGRRPTPRPSCRSGIGARGPGCRRRFLTGEPGSHTHG